MLGRDARPFVIENAVEDIRTEARVPDGGCDSSPHVVHGDIANAMLFTEVAHGLGDAVLVHVGPLGQLALSNGMPGRKQVFAGVAAENLLKYLNGLSKKIIK